MSLIITGKAYTSSGVGILVNIEITDPEVIALFKGNELNYFSIAKDGKIEKDEFP